MLWGNHAKSKAGLIDQSKHLILSAVHPSPLSAHRGFFGCKHFSKANEFLNEKIF
jgi:uracil-DNA glycosylase